MGSTKPLEASRQGNLIGGAEKGASDVMAGTRADSRTTLPSKSSLIGPNFSYPRQDGHTNRHESSDSLSSVASHGSAPGMTYSSDSDASFEDDGNYNTSASELWDSFWPEDKHTPEEQTPAYLWPSQTLDYFNLRFSKQDLEDTEDDTITISLPEQAPKASGSSHDRNGSQSSSSSRPSTRRAAVTYSVYPKPSMTDLRRLQHPPRSSSLRTESPSPPRRHPFLRTSKSSAALKPSKSVHNLLSKSSHNLKQHYLAPPISFSAKSSTSITNLSATKSVPVSPAYPPPPPPTVLRPSASAFSLRDRSRHARNKSLHHIHTTTTTITASNNNNNDDDSQKSPCHNATAPLTPLITCTTPSQTDPTPPCPAPPLQRFVSVFELDSDHESEAEDHHGFAKRFARGLHKKSASEKKAGTSTSTSTSTSTPIAAFGAVTPSVHDASSLSTSSVVAGEKGKEVAKEKEKESEKDRDGGKGNSGGGGSPSRKRGGSLGRIFGLMGR